MRAPWIVLEGLDGTGKSSLAAALASKLGAKLLATPGVELEPIRSRVLEGLGREPIALVAFYGATVLARGHQARTLTEQGVPVVMDRYLASTVAYARAREVDLDLDWLIAAAPRPDLQLLVTLPEWERRARLTERGISPEDRETFHPAFAAQVMTTYRALMPGAVEVENLDPLEQVATRLAAALTARAHQPPPAEHRI